jgi:single-stranded DNA-binding protein
MSMAEFLITGAAGDKAHVRPVHSAEPDGEQLTRFSIAVHRGRERQVTDWYNCVAFGKTGERAATIEKGDRVFAKGRIELEVIGGEGEKKFKRASFVATYVEVYAAKHRLEDDPFREGQ